MYKYKRFNINLNESKIKEKYSSKTSKICCECSKSCKSDDIQTNIDCIKEKWNTQRDDWEQGFDSDCFAHCCQPNLCLEILKDTECHNKGHMSTIIVEFDEKIPGFEECLKIEN